VVRGSKTGKRGKRLFFADRSLRIIQRPTRFVSFYRGTIET
jgi:hypothetical protein